MAYKNTAITITYLAWDTANNVGKTGDAANHTLRGVGDGTEYTPSSPSITEVDSTNCPGLYKASLTAGENNYTNVTLHGKSSSSSIVIIPTRWQNETSADAVKLGGTAQTGRDIGASVLLSPGTGTGQLDFTGGIVKSNLSQILGTALTETAGQIAAAFKKFFNVASPTLTCLGIDQTGDSYARLGAPVGASISADVAAVQADTDNIQTRLPAALVSGRMDASVGAMAAGVVTAAAVATDAIDADALAADAVTEIGTGVWASATRTLTSFGTLVQDIWDKATSALITVGSIGKLLVTDIDATISSRLATSGYTAPDNISITAIKAKTDNLPASPAAVSDIPTSAQVADAVWDEAISGHLGAGSTGAALNAAGSAGDPWTTPLPGAYGAGTAGQIVGTNLDVAVSSRLATLGYTAPPTAAQNADKILGRNLAGGSDGGRTVTEALRPLRNKVDAVSVPGSVLIMAEDDTTESWRAALTTDAAALPIVEIDPT